MKKYLSLLLSVLLLLSLCACGITQPAETDDPVELVTLAPSETRSTEKLPDSGEASTDGTTDPNNIIATATTEDENLIDPLPIATQTTAPTEAPVQDSTQASSAEQPNETLDPDELPIDLFTPVEPEPAIAEDGVYTSKDDVALYIHTYGKLPQNFITKSEARSLGWEGGSLEPYAPGKCIGGDYFGNYEGLLPTDRKYTECDIDTLGAKSRGAKRIVFSNDGLIYYTDDHYESFTLLYGEE